MRYKFQKQFAAALQVRSDKPEPTATGKAQRKSYQGILYNDFVNQIRGGVREGMEGGSSMADPGGTPAGSAATQQFLAASNAVASAMPGVGLIPDR